MFEIFSSTKRRVLSTFVFSSMEQILTGDVPPCDVLICLFGTVLTDAISKAFDSLNSLANRIK